LDDLGRLCALYAAGDALHRSAHPEFFREVAEPSRREEISEILSRPDTALIVAEQDSHVVGCLHVFIRRARIQSVHRPRHVGVIDNLVVAESERRQGHGAILMDAAHAWLIERGVREAELNVYRFNEPALAFYEHEGYQPLFTRLWRRL
jgi:ribosomal protein S18 acetylase RimI-like enzyme